MREGQRVDVPGPGVAECPRRLCECRPCRQDIVDQEDVGAVNLCRIGNVERAAYIGSPFSGAHRSRLNTRLSQSHKSRNGIQLRHA